MTTDRLGELQNVCEAGFHSMLLGWAIQEISRLRNKVIILEEDLNDTQSLLDDADALLELEERGCPLELEGSEVIIPVQ